MKRRPLNKMDYSPISDFSKYSNSNITINDKSVGDNKSIISFTKSKKSLVNYNTFNHYSTNKK